MRRLVIPAAVLIGLVLVSAGAAANTARDADAQAVSQASALIPQAHWRVVSRYLDISGSEVDYGNVHLANVVGPSWVVQLRAPGHPPGAGYEAAVVINAVTGDVTDSGAAVSASATS